MKVGNVEQAKALVGAVYHVERICNERVDMVKLFPSSIDYKKEKFFAYNLRQKHTVYFKKESNPSHIVNARHFVEIKKFEFNNTIVYYSLVFDNEYEKENYTFQKICVLHYGY